MRRAQAATSAVCALVTAAGMHVLPAVETGELTERAAIGTSLSAEELRSIAEAIGAAAHAYGTTREKPDAALDALTSGYRSLQDLQRAIAAAIGEGGRVEDRASPALARIRKSLSQAQSEARDRVSSLLRSAKHARAIQDAVVTIREGRFVVPVKAEFSSEIPGIVHDTSSSGQTLFVEPLAALEANNRVRTLRIDEEREVRRVLDQLSRSVGERSAQIEANIEMLAGLDVLVAKASMARATGAQPPELSDGAELTIHDGRHPLLSARAVPQSLTLDEETRLLVISGPNMGGKTVALKMAGLFVLMAYAGLQLPAASSRVGTFSGVIADIGDEQSIAENTSTFSAHLRRMREILETADRGSLVLIDEIGGGTEPASGAALAIAMLERLLQAGSAAIVTTHNTELKLFAHETRRAANASVRFDPVTFAPTYHLDLGSPGQSLAFPLASAMGIPQEVIDRADRLLSTRDRDYERALAELAGLNARLQGEHEALARERAHVAALQRNVRSRLEALEREKRAFLERAESRMHETLRAFADRLAVSRAGEKTAPKITKGQAALLQRAIEDIRSDLGLTPAAPASAGPDSGEDLEGSTVRIVSLGQDGSVIADNGESLLVAIGPMKTVVARRDVQRLAASVRSRSSAQPDALLEAVLRTALELDVRGKRYVEAEPIVERWIDEAVLAGSSPLRLVHGKGTGLLGRGLQEFLRAHAQVKNVRYGSEDEGGSGVTIFELR